MTIRNKFLTVVSVTALNMAAFTLTSAAHASLAGVLEAEPGFDAHSAAVVAKEIEQSGKPVNHERLQRKVANVEAAKAAGVELVPGISAAQALVEAGEELPPVTGVDEDERQAAAEAIRARLDEEDESDSDDESSSSSSSDDSDDDSNDDEAAAHKAAVTKALAEFGVTKDTFADVSGDLALREGETFEGILARAASVVGDENRPAAVLAALTDLDMDAVIGPVKEFLAKVDVKVDFDGLGETIAEIKTFLAADDAERVRIIADVTAGAGAAAGDDDDADKPAADGKAEEDDDDAAARVAAAALVAEARTALGDLATPDLVAAWAGVPAGDNQADERAQIVTDAAAALVAEARDALGDLATEDLVRAWVGVPAGDNQAAERARIVTDAAAAAGNASDDGSGSAASSDDDGSGSATSSDDDSDSDSATSGSGSAASSDDGSGSDSDDDEAAPAPALNAEGTPAPDWLKQLAVDRLNGQTKAMFARIPGIKEEEITEVRVAALRDRKSTLQNVYDEILAARAGN